MSPKIKYILSLVAALLSLIILGVVSIVLFRAKRSTAPETNLPSNIVRVQSGEVVMNRPKPLDLPVEKMAAEVSFSDLPEMLRDQFKETLPAAKVYKIKYEGDVNGYRLEQDVKTNLQSAVQVWKNQFPGWRGVRAVNRRDMYELEVSKDAVRVYVQLDALTESTTGEKVRILYEK